MGDWTCPGCGDHQFGRNQCCRQCATPKPGTNGLSNISCVWCTKGECWTHGKGGSHTKMLAGDWLYPGCGDHQFGRNDTCRKCSTPKPVDGKSVATQGSYAKVIK